MKKAIGWLLALALVALLALPPLVGRLAEDAFTAQTEQEPFGDYLDVRIVEYDRGWYRSTATVELGLDSSFVDLLRAGVREDTAGVDSEAMDRLEAFVGDGTLRLVTEYAHGPVGYSGGPFVGLARGEIHPELPSGAGEEVRRRLDVPYLARLRHRIGFRGASRLEVGLPPIDFEGDTVRMTLRGGEGWIEYAPGSRRVAGEAALEFLEVADAETNLRVESLSAAADGTLLGPSLLLGEGGVHLERLSLLRPLAAVTRIDLVGFDGSGGTEAADDGAILNSSFTYAADSLIAGEVGMSAFELRMAMLNLDRAAAERWTDFTRQAALEGEEVDEEAIAREMSGVVYDFLAAGPVLEIDPARFDYGGEPFRARVRLATDASVLPAREEFDLLAAEGAAFWTGLMTAEVDLEAARTLARTLVVESQVRMMRAQLNAAGRVVPDRQLRSMAEQGVDALLSGLVQQGYLTEEEDRFVSRVTYEGGQLTANGQPLSIPGR